MKVDCNGLLEFDSCHRKNGSQTYPWDSLDSTDVSAQKNSDFQTQSEVLKRCFKEKKFPIFIIKVVYNRANTL